MTLFYMENTLSIHFNSFSLSLFFFFFNDTATTEIYTLSLHDALPISQIWREARYLFLVLCEWKSLPQDRQNQLLSANDPWPFCEWKVADFADPAEAISIRDRKSTRLNSSHANISYAVFCLKKKKNNDLSAGVSSQARGSSARGDAKAKSDVRSLETLLAIVCQLYRTT